MLDGDRIMLEPSGPNSCRPTKKLELFLAMSLYLLIYIKYILIFIKVITLLFLNNNLR